MVKLQNAILRSECKKNCLGNDCSSSLELTGKQVHFPGLVPDEDATENIDENSFSNDFLKASKTQYKSIFLYVFITLTLCTVLIQFGLYSYIKIPYIFVETSFSKLIYSNNELEPYQTYLQSHSPEIYEEILKELRQVQEAATYLQKKQKAMEKKTYALQYQLKKLSIVPQNLGIINEAKTRSLIKEALDIYDADKLGLRDYALESAGGSVISTPSTKPYVYSTHYVIFGIISYQKTSNPRQILQPNVHPGQCFAFEGYTGNIRIKLANLIHISAVTLEHAPISLLTDEDIQSAPQDFELVGLDHENADNGMSLGYYRYSIDGPSIQTFLISYPGNSVPLQYIELSIKSNYGNEKYTCIYRIRIHGRR